MTDEASVHRRVFDRPGRVAAVGGAAIVCVLSLSGALGISHTGLDASGPPGQSAGVGSDGAPGTGTHAGGDAGSGPGSGPGASVRGTPESSGSSHRTTPASPAQGTALPARSGTGKRVVFDVSAQRVWLVNDDDSVERTYLVSGSKFDNLDNGTYQVYSRSRYATAYNSDETMNYMVRFATGKTAPIGFHSIPAMPDGTLVETRAGLGVPASDGCIRQWITDARALWDFAPDGTTVVVRA